MISREPNTQCARCGKPIYRRPSALANKEVSYCSGTCYGAARTNKRDNTLAYVSENIATLSIPEMAKELQITVDALAYRITTWRNEGRLPGRSRPYTLHPKQKPASEYFRWRDFENDVIVGGNLYPDEVVVSGR